MRLSDEQIRGIVKNRIAVDHQKIAICKGLLLKNFTPHTDTMIASALRELGFPRPTALVLKTDQDQTTDVERLADYFSWSICAVEAVWALVHTNVLLPGDTSLNGIPTTIQISQVSGGGSSTGSEDFTSILKIPGYPQTLMRSHCQAEGYLLSDPDLFLQALQPNAPAGDVAEALRECIRCFRADLYLACAVMLGKASEGIWIELGKALVDALPKAEQPKRAKLRADLDNTVRPSLAAKLREIESLYATSQRELAHLGTAAMVSLDQFRLAFQWADMVRDSRNIVHYGSQPNIPNNYTNVSTLLLGGSTHLRNLLALCAAAAANPGT